MNNLVANFDSFANGNSNLAIFLKYYGFYLTAKFSFTYLRKLFSMMFLRMKHKYKKFPLIRDVLTSSGDSIRSSSVFTKNYILFNWNCLQSSSDRELVNYLIKEGYNILILVSRKFKEEVIKAKLYFLKDYPYEEEFISIKSYNIGDKTNLLIEDDFSKRIYHKLSQFHNFYNHISIFVNYSNNDMKSNLNLKNLENNLIILKVCVKLMILDRGESLIIGMIGSESEPEVELIKEKISKKYLPNTSSPFYKFSKNFYKTLKSECTPKINIEFLKDINWSSMYNSNNKINIFKNLILSY